MQRLQIHRSHNLNGQFDVAKTACICTNRCRQIEDNTNRYFSSKIEKPNHGSLMSKIANYFGSTKAVLFWKWITQPICPQETTKTPI